MMKVLMTKEFYKWAKKRNIPGESLLAAAREIEEGCFETQLGNNLLKKRIAFTGQGKRGSGRSIVCFKQDDRTIFMFGFAKNEKDTLSPKELKAFKLLAKEMVNIPLSGINSLVKEGVFVEVQR